MKRVLTRDLLAFLFLISFPAAAQVDSGSAISVYWQSTRQVDIRGATSVVILDPEIAKAELDHDSIRFQGLSLGETVALVGIDGQERAMIVRVILRPVVLSPAVLGRDLERGFGTTANDAQISRIGGSTDIALRHGFDWMQEADGDRVSAKFDLAEDTARGMHRFDVRSGSIDYTAPHYGVALFDFGQDLSGNAAGGGASLPYVLSDYVSLRGARVTWTSGRDSFAVFAGTTIPFYFLTL
ncbi:MAG TPA: hypothetical protein VJ853_15295, partial [Thermoanaerobaculia bacterium]|nr:hypothetical protein [Thermoanaerobaculia bacterium]